MLNYRNFYILFLLLTTNHAFSESPEANAPQNNHKQTYLVLTAPEGWRSMEAKDLSPSVKMMVVGKGDYEFPPSINIGTEVYPGTLKAYLKRIKEINSSKGAEFKDLGTINIEAGVASLSQVDKKTEWGNVRMMHVIFKKDDTIYIATAAARREEFPTFYKSFFNALKSLKFEERK